MKVMKKYMIMCMAVVALLLASCKNEDISISREVKFTVNPYDVINGFVNNQANEGDLDLLPSSLRVRTQVFVYDMDGKLVDYDVDYLQDYHSTMEASFDLSDGNFIAIATTDVVQYNSSVTFEFWNFEGKEKLTELKINHAGYLGYESKILGVGRQNVNVQHGQTEYAIRLEPQGALALCIVWGIHSFNDVTSYDLMTNRSFKCCSFNSDGTWEMSCEEAIFNKYVYRFEPNSYSAYGGYGYQFIPAGGSSYRWDAETTSGVLEDITDGSKNLSVASGNTYQFELFLPELDFSITNLNSKGLPRIGEQLSKDTDESQCYGVDAN